MSATSEVPSSPLPLLDRDHSILAFNWRVFDWACRQDVPLLERLRYLCIVSSNLDEFFEVRAEPHVSAKLGRGQTPGYSAASFDRLSAAVHELVERQYALYNEELMPAFEKQGIKILTSAKVTKVEKGADSITAHIEDEKGGKQTITADRMISAVGVVGNIENLG
ncbi:MAG: FAD-dependent oxidoreductase, partial [Hylemonella sp.]